MPEDSVKVAVRVRPFNSREKERQAKCVIQMNEGMTTIYNPEVPNDEGKKFTFDYSYWSHDQFRELPDGVLEGTSNKYHSQRDVFNDLGQGVLDNAFEGYNCSLFAYGQTGSGKSYSMVGYGPNKGIVPITCDELFKAINNNTDTNKRFEVTFSMLEIYNEQVRDLLSKDTVKGGLQVRQNAKLGAFYVEGLKKIPVGSYADIDSRMTQGTANRTVASTNMNATSSRAHTVVTITFDQIIKKPDGSETKKSSVMNLVDLAGSERADSTGATGDRLKEGANINKSLSALGNVISALADIGTGKKKTVVPYRDSVLTKLLQHALGGNSKTVMIAALSPADINYEETLSTLRYADRAKKIKNKAVINENPMEKLVRELREENERLRLAMEGGAIPMGNTQGMTPEEIEKMRQQMEAEIRSQLMANEQMMGVSAQDWEAKLAEARQEGAASAQISTDDQRKKKFPHLMNLNEDDMLSGVICYFLEKDSTSIGRSDGSPKPDICLSGLSIQIQHATIKHKNNVYEIAPCGYTGSKTRLNGILLTTPSKLTHKDRILFGSNHLYVFHNPKKAQDANKDLPKEITYEFAQKELAKVKGFATGGAGLTKDQVRPQEQVLEILPMVSDVNAISEELNKYKSFEVALISGAAQEVEFGKPKGTTVMVKMKNLLNGNTWMWHRGKFMNRRYLMQEIYQKYLDGEDVSNIPQEKDPFWEPTEDHLIGTANVFLQSLAYALDFDDRVAVTDYKGQEEGFIYVNITPCLQNGKAVDDDYFVDNPKDLSGKPYHFKVYVKSADVHKARYSKGLKVRYRVYDNKEYVETKLIKGTLSPEFDHTKVFSFPSVDDNLLDFFDSGSVTLLLYGTQEDKILDTSLQKLSTRELRQNEYNKIHGTTVKALQRRQSTMGEMGTEHAQLRSEVMLLQKKYERLAQKEKRLQQLCDEWKSKPLSEQEYEAFYRAISAAAFSTGTKFKTRVTTIYKRDPDTISLYVFGEDEESLAIEAQKNGGFLNYDKVQKFCPPDELPALLQQKQIMKSNSKNSRLQHSDSFSSVDLEPFLCDRTGSAGKQGPLLFKKHRIGDQATKPSVALVKPMAQRLSPVLSTKEVPQVNNGDRTDRSQDKSAENVVKNPTSRSCVLL